jgi:hypothetical protein
MATFGTFVSGQILTAAELNTAGEWQSYTPTWTQSATITKTVNWARYTQLGKWVQGSVKMTATGAGTASNVIKVGLPVNASTSNFMMGTASIVNESETPDQFVRLFSLFDSASTLSFFNLVLADSNTDITKRFGETGAGTFTVASGDIMYVQFAYEAA